MLYGYSWHGCTITQYNNQTLQVHHLPLAGIYLTFLSEALYIYMYDYIYATIAMTSASELHMC